MSGFWRNRVATAFAASLAAIVAASSAHAAVGMGCYAMIKAPLQGSSVEGTGTVEGVSDAKGDVAVWVLTHRRGMKDWWPQGGGPVSGMGDWSAKVTYGTAKEAGEPFEIAVIPVDSRTSDGLSGWLARAMEYSEYPGISLPPAAKGCRYNIVQVRRQ